MARSTRGLIVLTVWAIAGWAARGEGAGADTPKVVPKREHLAFASDVESLDGPALEALGSGKGALPTTDAEGNLYLICKYSTCHIRCIRADGWVETIAGDDRWPGNLKLAEGPAAYFANRWMGPQAGDYSKPPALITVYGLPLKGKGSIYFYWPGQSPYRIYRDEEKGNRWWFKLVGAPGKAKPPTSVGQVAKVEETDLTGAVIGKDFIAWQGNLYLFDEAKQELKCVHLLADYWPKMMAAYKEWAGEEDSRTSRGPQPFEHVVRADDGAFYMVNYWYGPPKGVFMISADGSRVEHIVADNSWRLRGQGVGGNRNGAGLETTWHCGPAELSTSGNILFLHSIDSSAVRRWKDGRVSALCHDGEWRETPAGGRGGRGEESVWGKHYQPGVTGVNYIYITYPGEENGGDRRVLRFGPVDFSKATVGALAPPLAKKAD